MQVVSASRPRHQLLTRTMKAAEKVLRDHLIHCPTCGNLREQKPYEVKKEAPDIFRRCNIS